MSNSERSKAEDIRKVLITTESRGSAKNRCSSSAQQTRISIPDASCRRSRVLHEPYHLRSRMTMCHQLVVSGDGGARQEGKGPSQVAWK